jgi:hypothetical protein
MKRYFSSLFLILCVVSLASAQKSPDDKSKKLLEDAKKNGRAVPATTVNASVHIQAVLIPRIDAKRIFGKDVGDNYAVIEVIVENKSPDAALIIHGIFMDYSNWPLSGVPPSDRMTTGSTDPYQASSVPNQVASEEYRVVRGQLLDAQVDTVRNRFIRWLTLAGNLAGAFTFSIGEQGIVKGIAAATGVGIPGVATAWPDRTVEQLNRVSDFGFHSPQLVSKQGSQVIVCFFPIDRFLTPGFRKLFLKSPALFFAPLQMLFDKTSEADVKDALEELGSPFDYVALRDALKCFMVVQHNPGSAGYAPCLEEFGLEVADPKTGKLQVKVDDNHKPIPTEFEKFKKFMTLDFIGSVSLNRVTVTVDGVMSVDINTIPPRIGGVELDDVVNCGSQKSQCFWSNIAADSGVRSGIVQGSYVTGGTVNLAEANALGITEVKTISEGSTDQELHFSFKLTKPIDDQTKLHFTVTKPAPGDDKTKTLDSLPWEYLVEYSPSAPTIRPDVKQEEKKLTVKGESLFDQNLVVKLIPPTGSEVEVKPTSVAANGEQIVVTIPDDAKPAGCWRLSVNRGKLSSNRSNLFLVKPSPKLDSAIRDTTRSLVILTGDDLIHTSPCGGPAIMFQLKKEGAATINITQANWEGDPVNRQAGFRLPAAAKDGSGWTVHLLVDGKDVANVSLQ